MQSQFRQMRRLFTETLAASRAAAATGKSSIPIFAGDFNCHVGLAQQGAWASALPPLHGDAAAAHQPDTSAHAPTGRAFLNMLDSFSCAIVTNRLLSGSGRYTRQMNSAQTIIDLFLVPVEWWPAVRAEGVLEDFGPLVESDHNLVFVDVAPGGSAAQGAASRLPPVFRPRFRVHARRSIFEPLGHGI